MALAMLTWPTIEELLIDQHFMETCKVKVVADDFDRLEEGLRPNCIMRHLEG